MLPGSTVYVAKNTSEIEKFTAEIKAEMKSVFLDTATDGVLIKCDTIGSLEAIVSMLRQKDIPIARADIGPINRRDIMQARAIKENDRHLGVILAFNVKVLPDAQEEAEISHVRIFPDGIIYSLIESYEQWVMDDTAHEEDAIFAEITPIAKFTFLKGYVFHNSDPAVFGIRVDSGILRQKIQFMNNKGRKIGQIHQLQEKKKTVQTVKQGQEVACSVKGITVGRQIAEEDVFYTLPTSREAKKLLKDLSHKLSSEEFEILNHIVEVQRKLDPAYAY